MVFDCLDNLDVIDITTDNNSMLTTKEQKIRIKKYLGLILDHKLQFHEYIEYKKKKIAKRIDAMYKFKNFLPLKYPKMFANSLMLAQFDYLDIIWCRAGKPKPKELDILDEKTAKTALDNDIRESSKTVCCDMKWLP